MAYEETISSPNLSLHISNEECAPVLECRGRVTSDTADFLKSEVKFRFPENGKLILDLSDVTRMDSTGLGTIVGLYLSAKSKNCELEIINLNKQIHHLFALTNLLSLTKDVKPPAGA